MDYVPKAFMILHFHSGLSLISFNFEVICLFCFRF